MYIVFEGIDGSGKGTYLNILAQYLKENYHYRIFDFRRYEQKNLNKPSLALLSQQDVILLAEPTYSGIGREIRETVVANGSKYSMKEIANYFSRDREILYRDYIAPLRARKILLQERNVLSSLVYQNSVGLDYLLSLSGNLMELQEPPDLLVYIYTAADQAITRLQCRDKKDNSIFEKYSVLSKNLKLYESLLKYFPTVMYIDNTKDLELVKEEFLYKITNFLSKYFLFV